MEIQVCSNHDPWGYDGATIGDQSFTYDYIGKIFFSRTTGPGKLRFIWKLPDIEEIHVCSNHDPRGYDGATIGDQNFTYDYIGKLFKNLLLKNHWARKAEIYMEASWYSGDSCLFNSWSPGVRWGPNRGCKFYIWLYREIFKNLLNKKYLAIKAEICMEASWFSGDSSLFKSWPPGVRWGHNRWSKFYIRLYRGNL